MQSDITCIWKRRFGASHAHLAPNNVCGLWPRNPSRSSHPPGLSPIPIGGQGRVLLFVLVSASHGISISFPAGTSPSCQSGRQAADISVEEALSPRLGLLPALPRRTSGPPAPGRVCHPSPTLCFFSRSTRAKSHLVPSIGSSKLNPWPSTGMDFLRAQAS